MDQKLAKFLVECSEEAGNEARVIENYSGRGMYGRETCAVATDSIEQLLADVINFVSGNVSEEDSEEEGWRETYWNGPASIPEVSGLRSDSLGWGVVIY